MECKALSSPGGLGSSPAYFAALWLSRQELAAGILAGHRGTLSLPSSHMRWASSAVPQKANTDASEPIVLQAARSPPSGPVGMMFPGLC